MNFFRGVDHKNSNFFKNLKINQFNFKFLDQNSILKSNLLFECKSLNFDVLNNQENFFLKCFETKTNSGVIIKNFNYDKNDIFIDGYFEKFDLRLLKFKNYFKEFNFVGEFKYLSPGSIEIYIKGDSLFDGYLYHDNSNTFENGWFPTGDIGTFDKGILQILDRKKDMILVCSENVYTIEVENVLNTEGFHWNMWGLTFPTIGHDRLSYKQLYETQHTLTHSASLADCQYYIIVGEYCDDKPSLYVVE